MYKVIIIEDDPMVASINKQYVELTSSFHVEATFKNGILALQYLQNCTVDLIILDYYTPQMNGDEFIDQLHAAGMTPAIIMVTSATDAETVRRLISRGVTDYLVKPFEYDRFKAALERFAKRQEELKTSASTAAQTSTSSPARTPGTAYSHSCSIIFSKKVFPPRARTAEPGFSWFMS